MELAEEEDREACVLAVVTVLLPDAEDDEGGQARGIGRDPAHVDTFGLQLLADEAIAEILVAQAKKFPARRGLAERYLERAELRSNALHEEITKTGGRILSMLAPEPMAEAAE